MLPIRAVVDHHVDRPGVEAWQHVKLTGTNRSTGFIALIADHHKNKTNDPGADRASRDHILIFAGLVAMAGRKTPDPIPNSAVKLPSANGTSSRRRGRVGRCQACKDQNTNQHHTNPEPKPRDPSRHDHHTRRPKPPTGNPGGGFVVFGRTRPGRAGRAARTAPGRYESVRFHPTQPPPLRWS